MVSSLFAEQSPQERGQYEFAEQEAKARKVGLWRFEANCAMGVEKNGSRVPDEAKSVNDPKRPFTQYERRDIPQTSFCLTRIQRLV